VTQIRWKRLEEYLVRNNKFNEEFTAAEYAAKLDMDVPEATDDIQSYLRAQRTGDARDGGTLFVLRRVPGTRTRMARWLVGRNKADARGVGRTFHDDVRARAMRAFRPDLLRIAELNPRQARFVESQIHATIDGALVVLGAAVQGADPDDE
jgi:hypothetical protein